MASRSRSEQFVFGYGSLVSRQDACARPVGLRDFRRAWNVAMDNAVDLPGYKYFLDPSGDRPAVGVTFLNLVRAPGHIVNGIALGVTEPELDELDARERNYARTDVTKRVAGVPEGTVWAYLGTAAARERYESARSAQRAVIAREYYDAVLSAFARLGTEAAAEFAASTDAPDCPIRELERIDMGRIARPHTR